ncbi:hypothetical protein [Photobacterium leiognathi]|uniref:hypothetical protein n=2 Tax=Photobacterium leiognathi TaxID=553611 RepID=UPI003DA0CC7D
MNKFRYFALISIIAMTTACDVERKVDFESFSLSPNEIKANDIHGFIITNTNNPLAIPQTFNQIQQISSELLNSDWLSSPNYASDISKLLLLLKETQLTDAQPFINELEQAKRTYRTNLLRINAYAQTLQRAIDKTSLRYNNEISEHERKIALLTHSNDYYLNKIAVLDKQIQVQQQKFFDTRNDFYDHLNKVVKDPVTAFNINDNLNFELKEKKTPKCEHFWGDYELLNIKDAKYCTYINLDALVRYITPNNKEQVINIIQTEAVKVWQEMTYLNGFYDTKTNKHYFVNNLRSQLIQAQNNYADKQTLCRRKCPSLLALEQQLVKLKEDKLNLIDKALVDENNKINIHSVAFSQLLKKAFTSENLGLSDPLTGFATLYRDPQIVSAFTTEYAHKIIDTYPKEYTISVSQNGNYIKPKIKDREYSLYFSVEPSCSIIYQPTETKSLPKVITSKTNHVQTKDCGLEKVIEHNLKQKWFKYV